MTAPGFGLAAARLLTMWLHTHARYCEQRGCCKHATYQGVVSLFCDEHRTATSTRLPTAELIRESEELIHAANDRPSCRAIPMAGEDR